MAKMIPTFDCKYSFSFHCTSYERHLVELPGCHQNFGTVWQKHFLGGSSRLAGRSKECNSQVPFLQLSFDQAVSNENLCHA